jgi:hypothetical protein
MKVFLVEAVRNNNFGWSVFTLQGQKNLIDFLALVESENGEFKTIGSFTRMYMGVMSDIIVLYVKVPSNSSVINLFELVQTENEG